MHFPCNINKKIINSNCLHNFFHCTMNAWHIFMLLLYLLYNWIKHPLALQIKHVPFDLE